MCPRTASFQARVESPADAEHPFRRANACASHLVEVIYDDPNSQVVSCDASGGKYVLDKAVFQGKDITSIATSLQQNTEQWVVDVTLDGKAQAAFGALTTNQYNDYYSGYLSGDENDAVLNQIAVVLDGNVQSAPETDGAITDGRVEITAPQPGGFTQAQARALAAPLK